LRSLFLVAGAEKCVRRGFRARSFGVSTPSGPLSSTSSASKPGIARDHWLESLGLTVLRFFNRDILEHTEDVLRRIRAHIVASRSWPNLDLDAEPDPEPTPPAVLDPAETPSEPLSRRAGESAVAKSGMPREP
jgi:hypothetical protein